MRLSPAVIVGSLVAASGVLVGAGPTPADTTEIRLCQSVDYYLPHVVDLEIVDVTGDGDPDIVASHSGLIAILTGGPGATFGLPVDYAVISPDGHAFGARVLTSGDFDRDGDIDIATAVKAVPTTPTGLNANWIAVLANNGAGSLAPAELTGEMPEPLASIDSGLVAGHFDDDGDLDIVYSGLVSGGSPFHEIQGHVSVVAGGPGASFSSADGWRAFSYGNHLGVDVGDIDSDGQLDIVSLWGQGDAWRFVWTGLAGDVDFDSHPPTRLLTDRTARRPHLADVTGDGDLDLVFVAGIDDLVYVAAGLPGVAFAPPITVSIPTGSGWVPDATTGDLNRDGFADIVAGAYESGDVAVHVFAGEPGPGFAPPLSFPTFATGERVEVADINQDNWPDVIVAGNWLLPDPVPGTIIRHGYVSTLTNVTPYPLPHLSVDDVTVTEGDSGTQQAVFTLSLTAVDVRCPVTVDVSTVDGTATSPDDYIATTRTVRFEPGTDTATFAVDVVGDTVPEADETFTVELTGAVGAVVDDPSGLGTIIDNQAPVASDDVFVTYGTDTALHVTAPGVLRNDFDFEADQIGAELYAGPTDGFLQLFVDGSFVFVPDADTTVAEFDYVAVDGIATSEPAHVTIFVRPGCAGRSATVVGTAASETLHGTDGDDVIDAGPGDDKLLGGDGDDVLCGGPGDDQLNADRGNDDLRGGPGDDQLNADRGDDRLDGGDGSDVLNADAGDDELTGGPGPDDICRGDRGVDRLTAAHGCERITGIP